MPLNLEPSDIEIKIFQRLNDFATDNQLSLVDFWTTNRLCLALDQFLQLLDNAQFKITKPEVKELQDEGVQFVNLNALIEDVQTWKNEVQSISNFIILQKEAQQQKINLKDQHKVNKDQRSKTTKIQLRMDTAASRSTFNGKIRAISRQIQAEIQLSQKLIQAKNESDYELTLKVGQANDLCKKLDKKISYLINSQEQKIKIIQLTQSGAQAVKTRNAFGKQYEQLKKQSLNKGQQIEGTLQQDLKKTLVEIMYASDQLQGQIRLLERKGIGH